MTNLTFLQDKNEFNVWCDLLRSEGVQSYLEIGSKYGEALHRVALALPLGSRVVGVDLPRGTPHWERSEEALKHNVRKLNVLGYEAHLIWGDSVKAETIERVAELGPFDAVFIDANHTLDYVRSDWHNYGAMANKLVAFHDIGWIANGRPTQIDVPEFWENIKGGFRHLEIKMCPTECNNGIGVIWK